MTSRGLSRVAAGVGAATLAVALVAVGRVSAGTTTARDAGYSQGRTAGYADGLRAGELTGLAEGRALQEGAALPAAARQPASEAFAAGYDAGAADVFAGYDGGWLLSTPYVVTLARGSGAVPYRIASRTQLAPGSAYHLCPDGRSLCVTPSG